MISTIRKTTFATWGHFVVHCFVTAVLWSMLHLSYKSEAVMRLDCQILLKSSPLHILAGSAPTPNDTTSCTNPGNRTHPLLSNNFFLQDRFVYTCQHQSSLEPQRPRGAWVWCSMKILLDWKWSHYSRGYQPGVNFMMHKLQYLAQCKKIDTCLQPFIIF